MQEPTATLIRPAGKWIDIDLREIWKYRELLYFLTWRDVKIRYKQTAIGIAWAVLQPLLTTAVFTAIFSSFARFDTANIPYPLFALSGLIIWLYLHSSVTMASGSFISNTNLVTKVYFPRLIVPFAAVLAGIVDLLFGFAILGLMMIYYAASLMGPNAQIVFAPLFIGLGLVLTISLGTLFSALNVRYRDVKFALPFFLQVWMIASPIFYPAGMITQKWRLVYAINPLVGIMEGFRASIFGTAFDWQMVAVSAGSTLVIAVVSLFIFKAMEDDFADLI